MSEEGDYCFIESESASEEDLSLICEKNYIDFTREYYRKAKLGTIPNEMQRRFHVYQSGDNRPRMKPGNIEEAARTIIGQAKKGADLVQSGELPKVVSIGGGMHHAKPGYGEGFCLYNDVAFAAEYLVKEHGLERVLILDTDAHAGNGTSDYFYSDPRILLIDLHQDPRTIYPGTGFIHQVGKGKGEGFTINLPMPVYAGDKSYSLVLEEIVLPIAGEFNPQIIIRNGGSDPHFADELTSLSLTVEGFKMIGESVRQISKETCGGRVIDLIASGYNKRVLPWCWIALIFGLSGVAYSLNEPIPKPKSVREDASLRATHELVKEARGKLKKYWPCLR